VLILSETVSRGSLTVARASADNANVVHLRRVFSRVVKTFYMIEDLHIDQETRTPSMKIGIPIQHVLVDDHFTYDPSLFPRWFFCHI